MIKLENRYTTPLLILATAPSNPVDGTIYLNVVDSKLYIYYDGTWQVLHALTPGALHGQPFGLWLPFYRTYKQ